MKYVTRTNWDVDSVDQTEFIKTGQRNSRPDQFTVRESLITEYIILLFIFVACFEYPVK